MKKVSSIVFALVIIATMMLAACAPAAPAATAEPAAPAEATAAPVEATAAPVEATAAPVEPAAPSLEIGSHLPWCYHRRRLQHHGLPRNRSQSKKTSV